MGGETYCRKHRRENRETTQEVVNTPWLRLRWKQWKWWAMVRFRNSWIQGADGMDMGVTEKQESKMTENLVALRWMQVPFIHRGKTVWEQVLVGRSMCHEIIKFYLTEMLEQESLEN